MVTGVAVVLLEALADACCPVDVCGCETGLAASGEAVVSSVIIDETGEIMFPFALYMVAVRDVNCADLPHTGSKDRVMILPLPEMLLVLAIPTRTTPGVLRLATKSAPATHPPWLTRGLDNVEGSYPRVMSIAPMPSNPAPLIS
jgi:hypothetical protein